MTNEIIEKIPSDLLHEKIMFRLREFLPLLTGVESILLLEGLTERLGSDISTIKAFSKREHDLYHAINDTSDYNVLKYIHDELNGLELDRFMMTRSVPALHAGCTEYRDILARHAMTLVEHELEFSGFGVAPVAYSLISMGSDGREEQTLITDQDYMIVYDDGDEKVDDYFREFSEHLVERLAEIGFKKCTGNIMPSNPTWRGSITQWKKRLLAIVRYEFEEYAKNIMDLIVLSDARYVAGDIDLANRQIELIRGLEQDYFHAFWGMAKAATEMKLALGFMKRLWTEGSGEHKGEFNLKLLAWAPLVMNIRILAINQAIPATNTLKRIKHLEEDGNFSHDMAAGLSDAYHIFTRYRILLQIKVIKGIQDSSYYFNPYKLTSEDREKLRQALILIEDLQKTIHTNFNIM